MVVPAAAQAFVPESEVVFEAAQVVPEHFAVEYAIQELVAEAEHLAESEVFAEKLVVAEGVDSELFDFEFAVAEGFEFQAAAIESEQSEPAAESVVAAGVEPVAAVD